MPCSEAGNEGGAAFCARTVISGAWPSSEPIHNNQKPQSRRAAQARQTRPGGMHFQRSTEPETVSLLKSSDGEVPEDEEEKRGPPKPEYPSTQLWMAPINHQDKGEKESLPRWPKGRVRRPIERQLRMPKPVRWHMAAPRRGRSGWGLVYKKSHALQGRRATQFCSNRDASKP